MLSCFINSGLSISSLLDLFGMLKTSLTRTQNPVSIFVYSCLFIYKGNQPDIENLLDIENYYNPEAWLSDRPLVVEVRGPIPTAGEEKCRCPNMLFMSFAGMTLSKCAVLQIGTLTGGPLCRESHPLCRIKNHTVVHGHLYTFILQNRSVQCTPVHNPRERGCSSMYRKKE